MSTNQEWCLLQGISTARRRDHNMSAHARVGSSSARLRSSPDEALQDDEVFLEWAQWLACAMFFFTYALVADLHDPA